MSDVRDLLRIALADEQPPPDLTDRALGTARRRERRRRLGSAAIALVAFAGLGVGLWGAVRGADTSGSTPSPTVAPSTPGPDPSTSPPTPDPSRSPPVSSQPTRPPDPSFPPPFVPATRMEGESAVVPITFPDGSQAELVYPATLDLVSRGLQPQVSYLFLRDPPPRYEIVMIHGEADRAFFRGDTPLRTFQTSNGPVELWEAAPGIVTYSPPVDTWRWLRYRAGTWTVLALLADVDEARAVAQGLHPLETPDGFVAILTEPPVALSDESGEGEGPELVIGDSNPRSNLSGVDEEFRMIILTPHPRPCRGQPDESENVGGNTEYALKCLGGPEDQGSIQAGIYGPAEFVRDVFGGLEGRGIRYGPEPGPG